MTQNATRSEDTIGLIMVRECGSDRTCGDLGDSKIVDSSDVRKHKVL